MPDNPYEQPGYVPPSAPPPGYQGAVWPPPTSRAQERVSGASIPFTTLFYYADGSVPDFRSGTVLLADQGITIQGKAVLHSEIQMPYLIAGTVLCIGWVLIYLTLEYLFRTNQALHADWNQVRRIVIVPGKRRVCLVYDAPNYKGWIKTFSLAFRLDEPLYETFEAAARHYVPERVSEGKLRVWTSPADYVGCCGLLLWIIGFPILVAVASGG